MLSKSPGRGPEDRPLSDSNRILLAGRRAEERARAMDGSCAWLPEAAVEIHSKHNGRLKRGARAQPSVGTTLCGIGQRLSRERKTPTRMQKMARDKGRDNMGTIQPKAQAYSTRNEVLFTFLWMVSDSRS